MILSYKFAAWPLPSSQIGPCKDSLTGKQVNKLPWRPKDCFLKIRKFNRSYSPYCRDLDHLLKPIVIVSLLSSS